MGNVEQYPFARIRQRRRQMLVHSYIYYMFNENIVSDDVWQRWANELVRLQKEYGTKAHFHDSVFTGWTGDTGAHLPHDHQTVLVAARLLHYRDNPIGTKQRPKKKKAKRK